MSTTATETTSPDEPRRGALRANSAVAAVLLAVTLLTHGGSLNDGLFFDDHWHRATLRARGWSFDELVESATFDVPGELVNHWWQERPLQWRYARPVAMLFMKLEWLLSGGSAVGVHALGLGWHWLTAWLVYRLALWPLGHRGWALLAGVFFIIEPHAVFGISWTAARNAVCSGFLFVAAFLLYQRASVNRRDGDTSRLRYASFAGAVALWLLALFSRESAIIFPGLVVVRDLCVGGRRLLTKRLPAYGILALLALGYLYWRLVVFPHADAPQIYFTAPSGPEYALWAGGKLIQLLACLWLHFPMFLGLATYEGWSGSHVAVYALLIALLALFGLWYLYTSRGVAGRWLWPVWIVFAFIPVIPVFIMPHFAYLPAPAISIMLAIMLMRLRGRLRLGVTVLLIAAHLWSLGVYRYLYRGIVRSEQLLYADIRFQVDPPPAPRKLFLVNWPVAGIYATVALRDAWNIDELDGYVLTYAPHPLIMDRPATVERISENELLVATPPPGYFAGLSGRMLLDGMRPDAPLVAGTVVRGDAFDTVVLEADPRGVTKLKFVFKEPLDSPEYLFFVSSSERPAQRLDFGAAPAELDAEHAALFARARESGLSHGALIDRIVTIARPVAMQLADPLQDSLAPGMPVAPDQLDQLEAWWRRRRVSSLVDETRRWREKFAIPLRERDRYFAIARFAERMIRSDLFLTGDRSADE